MILNYNSNKISFFPLKSDVVLERRVTPSVGEDVERWKLSCGTGRSVNGTAITKNSMTEVCDIQYMYAL